MTLSAWAKNDWLKPHKTSKQEIDGLFSIVERELRDAQVIGISSDGKFTHAYRADTEAEELVDFAKEFERKVRIWRKSITS